jgi:hypothetical protein
VVLAGIHVCSWCGVAALPCFEMASWLLKMDTGLRRYDERIAVIFKP